MANSRFSEGYVWMPQFPLSGERGGLKKAVDQIDRAQNEILAIEQLLGTDPHLGRGTLNERLNRRLSRHGIPRGFTASRGNENLWLQFGVYPTEDTTSVSVIITFPVSYSVKPLYVLASPSSSFEIPLGLFYFVLDNSITTTTFLLGAGRRQNGTNNFEPGPVYQPHWIAVGGTPA